MEDHHNRTSNLECKASASTPDVQNPFVHKMKLSFYEKIKIGVMTVTVLPIRVVMIALSLFVAWGIGKLILRGHDISKPMRGWRRLARPIFLCSLRSLLFASGFHWIEYKGKQAHPEQAPILVGAPHTTFLDSMLAYICGLPGSVQRMENTKIPIAGIVTRFTQPVFVLREDANSRQNTIKEIRRRALSKGEWPQIAIFPEGTTTNRTSLISFKPGAFYPGVPVQPLTIRYKNKLDTVTWTWDGPGAFTCLWYTLCQFHNRVEVTFLPVYYPTEAEQNDARLYGRNVRAVLAKSLGVPVTDHTYEDIRLMNYSSLIDFPSASILVEFSKLSYKLGLSYKNMNATLQQFCEIAQSDNVAISINKLAQYLELPVSPILQELFDLYDKVGSGSIDFREYIIARFLISRPRKSKDTLELAFKVFDTGNKGYVTQSEFVDCLYTTCAVSASESKELFRMVDTEQKGHITFDQFASVETEKPEYARLFVEYNDLVMKSQSHSNNSPTQAKAHTHTDSEQHTNVHTCKSE